MESPLPILDYGEFAGNVPRQSGSTGDIVLIGG